MNPLAWGQVGLGTGWLVALAFVFALLTGRLIPKSTHEREMFRCEHDGNEWRTEGRIKDQQIEHLHGQIDEKDVQLRHMGEVGRTMETILEAVRPRPEGQP